jgi:molybdopterin/thiamine biosynthesis adenylyltransferase/rhodanese-related sulfurtransferase
MKLTKSELKRYSRHLLLSEVGVEGQLKLKSASVLIVGLGGLGSPLALYLAASGVGTLGLVDYDTVDESNLQRQIIHGTADIGRLKNESATEKLKEINPEITIIQHNDALTSKNAMEIIGEYDIVADGTDNFQTRYLVNDACVLLGKPNVYGSVYRFEGQVSVFWAEKGPCYRCLFPNPPALGSVPSCEEAGVLGVLPGVVGMLQGTEVIKLIIGKGVPLIGRLLLYDALDMKFSEIKLKANPNCQVCGDNPQIKALIDYDEFCGVKKFKTTSGDISNILENWEREKEMQPQVLSELKKQNRDLFLLDVREPCEYEICNIEGSVILPLSQVADSMDTLPENKIIVVVCHHGGRSRRVMNYLIDSGFKNVYNLDGGIDRYAVEVAPEIDRY